MAVWLSDVKIYVDCSKLPSNCSRLVPTYHKRSYILQLKFECFRHANRFTTSFNIVLCYQPNSPDNATVESYSYYVAEGCDYVDGVKQFVIVRKEIQLNCRYNETINEITLHTCIIRIYIVHILKLAVRLL